MPPSSPREPQRIAKLLARAGIASRREVERMIAEGRVALDGKVLTTPATVLHSLKGVTVDGRPVAAAAPARLFRFHKPAGLLTAERDPAGRPTIYDRLPGGLPRLMPVGRLDLNTEGLLLLTTDGELKRQLELPATGVERSYRARAFGQVSQAQLEELMLGIEIDGVRYGSIDANLERRTGANIWIELTLTEGKNREVRRVLEHLGLKVSRLIRTRYGPFHLGDMPAGAVDEVRQHDLILFRKALAGPGGGKAASSLQLSSRVKAVENEAPAGPDQPAAVPNRAARRRAAAVQHPPRSGEGDGGRRGGGGAARQDKPTRVRVPTTKSASSPSRASARSGLRPDLDRAGRESPDAGQGPGQRRRRPEASDGASKRKTAIGTAVSGKPKPARKPASPRDDDSGPLLDRPKRRYRPGDRRPRPPSPRRPRK